MAFIKKFSRDGLGMLTLLLLLTILIMGIFAAKIAPHDPNLVNFSQKLQSPSHDYLLGTDALGRCILSRLIFGIRTTFFYGGIAMALTITLGTIFGMIAGYSQGILREIILRLCDMLLSFPTEVMILAIVGILGPGLVNIVVANILSKWAWYTRMICSTVQQYQAKNYVKFAQVNTNSWFYVLKNHIFSGVLTEVITHASLEMGWVILSISSLSFLGLGVQAPTSEWGMMLNEAKNIMFTHPWQMLPPGLTILITICALNFFGDSLQQALHKKQQIAPRKSWFAKLIKKGSQPSAVIDS